MEMPEHLKKVPIELLIVIATLALYIIVRSVFDPQAEGTEIILLIISALIVFELIYFVGIEIKQGVKKHGWKHEVVDTLIAVFIAVLLWVGASIILNTDTPVSAVASCSMLPNLERGDFIIVQGADVEAYHISMSESELRSLTEGPFVAVVDEEEEFPIPFPLYYYCNCHPSGEPCSIFLESPEKVVETAGPFTYHYGLCEVNYRENMKGFGRCLEYVGFRGKNYYTNLSNDIVVYVPSEGELYRNVGDIVHRTFFKIDVDGKNYYLTKGDNNPIMDIQVTDCNNPDVKNYPVPEENLRGKVIGRVPYLGYLKLFISGLWGEDQQCNWQMSYRTVD